jgi:hypothetical protein
MFLLPSQGHSKVLSGYRDNRKFFGQTMVLTWRSVATERLAILANKDKLKQVKIMTCPS